MEIEQFIKKISELNDHQVQVGITSASNIQDRARIFHYLITDFGRVPLGEGERDPLFKENIDNIHNIKQTIINNFNNKTTYNTLYNILGNKILNDVTERIRTKGHGQWRPNTPYTIESKRQSMNPQIRSHANDIYQSEGYLLQSLTYKIV